jgi:hypothetical protein
MLVLPLVDMITVKRNVRQFLRPIGCDVPAFALMRCMICRSRNHLTNCQKV